MRDTRGYATRRLAENLWVPARLARGRAATLVAVVSTLALIAVLYVDIPLSGAVTPVASASESTTPHPPASGLCLTAAATVPTGAGASSGCTGASAAGADLPHRAGSAESPTAAHTGSASVIEQVADLVYRSTRSDSGASSSHLVIEPCGMRG